MDTRKQKAVDTLKDAAKETVKDAAKETAKDAAKDAAKGAISAAGQRVKENVKENIAEKVTGKLPEGLKHPTSWLWGGAGAGGGGGESGGMKGMLMGFGTAFLAAGTAATVAKTLVAPLEMFGSTAHETSVATQQGYMTYWRGNLSNVVRAFPNEGLNFALRDYYSHMLGIHNMDARREPMKYFWTTYFGGGAAGVVSLAVLYPIDAAYGSRLPTDLSRTLTEELRLKGGSLRENAGRIMDKVDPAKAGRELRDTAINAGKTIRDKTMDVVGKNVKESAQELGHKMKETAQDLGHKARETAQDLGHKARETAQDLGQKARETAQDVGQKARETAQDVGQKVRSGEFREAAEKLTPGKSGGMFGLYRGFMPSVTGAFVYRAAYFGAYDTVRAMYPDKSHFLWGWAFAQATTTVSSLLAHPFDIIRYRMMHHRDRYSGSLDCWGKTISQEGMSALFRGSSSSFVRSTGGALTLVFYDEIKKYLHNRKM